MKTCSLTKPLIDRISAKDLGFTEAELDFILICGIEYYMGCDGGEED